LIASTTFLENTFALDNQIVREFQTINVDVPIHPFRGGMTTFLRAASSDLRIVSASFFGNQFSVE